MTTCTKCNAKIPTLATRTKRVNEALHKLGLNLYNYVPYMSLDTILQTNDFSVPAYNDIKVIGQYSCSHEEVGDGKWLTIALYRHESGRYEVTAYVN